MNIKWILLLALGLALGCSKDSGEQLKIDQELIEQYLQDNNLVAEHNEDGLYYIIEDEGTGTEYPTISSTVKIKYHGYLMDGNVF